MEGKEWDRRDVETERTRLGPWSSYRGVYIVTMYVKGKGIIGE